MANSNPKGDERAVAFTFPPAQARFLVAAIADCKAGVEGDLAQRPQHVNAPRWQRESQAYAALLAGLTEDAVIHSDLALRRVVGELAEAIDRDNEYSRVTFEHAALVNLREQVEGARR